MRVLPKNLEKTFSAPPPTTFCTHKFITPKNDVVECHEVSVRESHGWLCANHYRMLHPSPRTRHMDSPYQGGEERDAAIVRSILFADVKDIKAGKFDLKLPFKGLVMEDLEALETEADSYNED